MAPTTNGRVLFNSALQDGLPKPGETLVYDTSSKIDLENVLLGGGFLLKTLILSVEPFLFGMLQVGALKIGEPIKGFGIGVVIRSETLEVQPGDHIYGFIQHEQYTIHKSLNGLTILENKYNIPLSVFVGAAGMPGRTAFSGWREHSKAKKGETVFISAGAGAVGSLVVQLAKLDGLKVIASAGSDDKVQFMKEIGADVAFNYKTEDTGDVLNREGPIDVYWDNVGGKTLEAAIDAAKKNARFIECGMISGYVGGGVPVQNLFQIIPKAITLSGFVVSDLQDKWEKEFQASVVQRIGSGEIKYLEDRTSGIDRVAESLRSLLKGENTGKSVIIVADE